MVTPVELFAAIGLVLAAIVASRRMASVGATKLELIDYALAAAIGGAIGAKLFYAIPVWLRGGAMGSWRDGSGFFGGLALGGVAVAVLAKLRGRAPMAVLDAVAPAIPLGFAVGKIGCYLAGCCYGKGGRPTQLYEMAFGVVLFALLMGWPSRAFAKYLAAYAVWRFGIEFLRDDPDRHGFGAALTDSQITALVAIPVASLIYFVQSRRATPGQNHRQSDLRPGEGEAPR